jgi:hypothetical protein
VEFAYWTFFCPLSKIIRIKVLECITTVNEEEGFGGKMKNMPETPNPSTGRILPLELVAYRFDCSFTTCGVIENTASNLVANASTANSPYLPARSHQERKWCFN